MRKHVIRKPAILAHTIRRRILLTGGSGADSTTAPAGLADVLAGEVAAGFAGAGGRVAGVPVPGLPAAGGAGALLSCSAARSWST